MTPVLGSMGIYVRSSSPRHSAPNALRDRNDVFGPNTQDVWPPDYSEPWPPRRAQKAGPKHQPWLFLLVADLSLDLQSYLRFEGGTGVGGFGGFSHTF